jgi:host factor-I protein
MAWNGGPGDQGGELLRFPGGEFWRRRTPPINDKRPQMPGEKAQNLQDAFLNHVRKQKVPVTIFLVNGVKLQGVITWFDNFCLLLRRDAQSQLVYKHAISTIMPGAPIQLFDPEHVDD